MAAFLGRTGERSGRERGIEVNIRNQECSQKSGRAGGRDSKINLGQERAQSELKARPGDEERPEVYSGRTRPSLKKAYRKPKKKRWIRSVTRKTLQYPKNRNLRVKTCDRRRRK